MEPDEITVTMAGGDRLHIVGPISTTRMWLEPRKWWQFWLPRYVEKWASWEECPDDAKPPVIQP